jgi:hypothetical protein
MAQIKIQDLLPLLKPGFVAMDECGAWWWFDRKTEPDDRYHGWTMICDCSVLDAFDIALFEGDWKDSLMECGK